jgi:hypothetical protein
VVPAFSHVPNIIPESCSDFLQFLLLITIIIINIRGHLTLQSLRMGSVIVFRKSEIYPLDFRTQSSASLEQ